LGIVSGSKWGVWLAYIIEFHRTASVHRTTESIFEDQELMLEERKTLYNKLDETQIDKKELTARMKKAEKTLILADMDVERHEVYELYKIRNAKQLRRCSIRIKQTVLNADKIYLQDDESVFGHVFISSLSLYSILPVNWSSCRNLEEGGLNRKLTPIDLLFKYGKVYQAIWGA
jgi:hypothetical protein